MLPICPFGASCYRKNPQHFAQYSHPITQPQHTLEQPPPKVVAPPAPQQHTPQLHTRAPPSTTVPQQHVPAPSKPATAATTPNHTTNQHDSNKKTMLMWRNGKFEAVAPAAPPEPFDVAKEASPNASCDPFAAADVLQPIRTAAATPTKTVTTQKRPREELAPALTVSPPKHGQRGQQGREDDEGDEDSSCGTGASESMWKEMLTAPPPRSSLLAVPTEDVAALDRVYEMPFPVDDVRRVWLTAVGLAPSDPLTAFPGFRLVGPFEVLNHRRSSSTDFFTSDVAKWTHWRHSRDPPEVQCVAIRTTCGDHTKQEYFAYHRDSPSEVPSMVVRGERRHGGSSSSSSGGGAVPMLNTGKFSMLCQHLSRALLKGMAATATMTTPSATTTTAATDKDAILRAANALRLALGLPTAVSVEKVDDVPTASMATAAAAAGLDTSAVVAARRKKTVATSLSGLGVVVPYDKKTELGYRPPMFTPSHLATLVQQWNRGTILPTGMNEITEQFQWADIANDECDFGLSLELGLNLLSLVEAGRRSDCLWHAWRLLEMAYSLLGRDLFRHILKCQLPRLASSAP